MINKNIYKAWTYTYGYDIIAVCKAKLYCFNRGYINEAKNIGNSTLL